MENNNNQTEIIETSAVVNEEEKKTNKFKKVICAIGSFFKKFKSGKIKNESFLKRGGYSLAITALVLAGLIVFNWLVSSLSDRFNLEFDMTTDKKNSMTEQNVEYIKNLDAEVNITVCGTEEYYADYMRYYAQNYYGVQISSYSEFEYFLQTVNLIEKYPSYNDKITVKYVDMQSSEFTAISAQYSDYQLAYGDIIVTSTVEGKERVKVLHFTDVYVLTENNDSYSYYGSSYTLTANRLETALTSAISYVVSADTKNVAIISGHSANNYTDAYKELLKTNNYEITEISDKLINSLSNEYDAIIISAPTIDFTGDELDVISEFLENDGKLGKGLLYFADASCPSLPNLNSFLKQWGIEIGEGMVFETNDSNHTKDSPTTVIMYPQEIEKDDITTKMLNYISVANYNVPMNICDISNLDRTATALIKTSDTTVAAPIGAASDWSGYTDEDKKQFCSVIQSVESVYDDDNNKIESYVMAFSSVEYVQSTWASYSDVCNQDIVMAATDRASHVGDTSMVFTSKVITGENFASQISEANVKTVNLIFMFIIPVIVIAAGIIVFVRRRNAR